MPPSSPRLTPEPPLPPGTRLTRFGSAVGVALIASVLSSGPAALRIARTVNIHGMWPSLCAVTLLPMTLAVLTLRQARVGVRAFSAPGNARSFTLALWIGGFLFTLVALGSLLRATTHHHPLAGATFGLASVTAGIALIPVSRRVSGMFASWQENGRTGLIALGGVALFVVTLGAVLVLSRIIPKSGPFSPSASANVIDVLAFAMTALLASRPEFAERRVFALFGPPLAAIVFAFGLRFLLATPQLATIIDECAPAFAPLVEVLGVKSPEQR
jgi:hypothetical protein